MRKRLLVLCLLGAARTAAAQQPRYSVYIDLGVLSSLANLNSSGTASFTGGLAAGGGLNWQMVPEDSSLQLQGDVTWTRKTLSTTKSGAGTKVDLVFIGVNLEDTWIQTRRYQFTIAGGGGMVAIHAEDSTAATRARMFARLGLGARYTLRPTLHAFVLGIAMIYDLQNFPAASALGPYARRQAETGFTAGLAVGF